MVGCILSHLWIKKLEFRSIYEMFLDYSQVCSWLKYAASKHQVHPHMQQKLWTMLQKIDLQRLLWPSNCCRITAMTLFQNLMINLWITMSAPWMNTNKRNVSEEIISKISTPEQQQQKIFLQCASVFIVRIYPLIYRNVYRTIKRSNTWYLWTVPGKCLQK